jgi:uncharacterized protein (DUF885 family)
MQAARVFLTFLLLVLAACQPTDVPEDVKTGESTKTPTAVGQSADVLPAESASDWDRFVAAYIEDFLEAHPAFAVKKGRHEFDGLLPDWSAQGIASEIARLHRAREDALTFSAEELGEQGQFQREYLLAAIDRELFWLEKTERPFTNPYFYFDFKLDSLDPNPYIDLDYAPLKERMKSYTRYARNIPRALDQIRSNLRMPMARTLLQYAIDSFGGFADYFRNDVPSVFAAVEDEALQQEFAEANAAAADAMQEMTEWLTSNLQTATENYAIGPELFRQMIYDAERVDVSLEELEAIALADLKRNQLALGEACAEFAPGESIRSCFSRMANRKPEGGSVETARRQLEETKAFLIEQDLVTIPGKEVVLVAESPPYARSNSAYINIPGPYENNQPSVYYISPPNPSWPEEVQQAYIPGESDLLFTSVHEVWPGHFLSFVHANRAEWDFGRIFVTHAFGEGWAHYAEEMMLEAGLRDKSPETRIGQLSNALLRNVRFLSSLGLHTKGMTVEESEKLFMEEAYQDRGTAEQQAIRGTYDPVYLNYTLGKLMIKALRDDWVAEAGGRAAWKEFHDTFLSYGGPPIPLVRAQMMRSKPEATIFKPE